MRRRVVVWSLAAILVVALALGLLFYRDVTARGLNPERGYIRVDTPTERAAVLREAERLGYVRSAAALELLARIAGRPTQVGVGTYRLSGTNTGVRSLRDLFHPIVQMLRLPSTNWAKRTSRLLERHEVCTADAYMAEVLHPQDHKTDFPLPSDTLEGYLYPDTYDLPPLLGAKAVVGRQLRAFKDKVWEPLGHPKDLQRILTVASLVELESGKDADRPMIAGVIQNRLDRHMKLQIDASILYGLGKWRRLTFKDYRTDSSPYNLYLHDGLPPTPICSPSIASIRAAMNPARHNDLYYVALPNGTTLFAPTYKEHLKNIERRKAAIKEKRT